MQCFLYSAGQHMFKVNNRNTRTRCEKCSKLTIKILLLILNIFHTLFWCFYCWFLAEKCWLGTLRTSSFFDIHGSKKTTHPMYTLPGISNSIGMKLKLGPVIAFLETETIYDVIFLVMWLTCNLQAWNHSLSPSMAKNERNSL